MINIYSFFSYRGTSSVFCLSQFCSVHIKGHRLDWRPGSFPLAGHQGSRQEVRSFALNCILESKRERKRERERQNERERESRVTYDECIFSVCESWKNSFKSSNFYMFIINVSWLIFGHASSRSVVMEMWLCPSDGLMVSSSGGTLMVPRGWKLQYLEILLKYLNKCWLDWCEKFSWDSRVPHSGCIVGAEVIPRRLKSRPSSCLCGERVSLLPLAFSSKFCCVWVRPHGVSYPC